MSALTSLVCRQTEPVWRISSILPALNLSTGLGNNEISPVYYNRNPRNLERLRIAYKPSGYHLEVPGREFWHKVILEKSSHHITAKLVHNTGFEPVTASSKEWAIRKYLYRTYDTAAYVNVGRVFAQRCIEAGFYEIYCDLKAEPGGKVELFVKSLEEGGLTLSEPPRFLPHRPWHDTRPEKPWDVTE